MENLKKILFKFHSDIFDEEIIETMWAIEINKEEGLFQLDNIPLYAPSIASEDIIHAEFDEYEQQLTFRKTVEYSGNSVVQIIIVNDKIETNKIRDFFKSLGCESEKFKENYFSIEIPFHKDYKSIKTELDNLEKSETIEYAEPSLSDKHRSDIV